VKFGGLKFLKAAHIKDVLAVLRWASNIRDRVSGFRVAQLLPGIGPSSAARLKSRSRGRQSESPTRYTQAGAQRGKGLFFRCVGKGVDRVARANLRARVPQHPMEVL
jgi:superfamily I DNA/RNA helicase